MRSAYYPPKYNLLEPLGQGGFGIVHKAQRTSDGKIVAIKTLNQPGSRSHLQRFVNEAKDLWLLQNHPHIVELIDYEFQGPTPYIAMEFCEFGSLRAQSLTYDSIFVHAQGIASGLAEIHNRGGIHRDIKPENLLLARGLDGQPVVKISDFGLANVPTNFAPNITQNARGTTLYWAPELFQGKPCTPATDVFALGTTLIELLTGSRQPDSLFWFFNVPGQFKKLLKRMVSFVPKNRPTCVQILDELSNIPSKRHFTAEHVLVAGVGLGVAALIASSSSRSSA